MNPFVCNPDQLVEEIRATQVKHVPLSEYAPGQPHYERLMEAIQNKARFSWPADMYGQEV